MGGRGWLAATAREPKKIAVNPTHITTNVRIMVKRAALPRPFDKALTIENPTSHEVYLGAVPGGEIRYSGTFQIACGAIDYDGNEG
jgi:hypothetical protein